MGLISSEELKKRAANVRLLVLDVDGVLTDGTLVYSSRGEELKMFHVRDGLGIRMALNFGLTVAVLTARQSEPVAARVRELGIPHYMFGREDKLQAFNELTKSLQISAEEACFVGDDILDVPVLRVVGLAVSVANAHPIPRSLAHYVTQAPGGVGAVREITDLLIDMQPMGGLEAAMDHFVATKFRRGLGRD